MSATNLATRKDLLPQNGKGARWQPSESDGQKIDFDGLFRIIVRRRKLLAAGVLLGILLATAYCILKTRRYEGEATVYVHPEGSDVLGSMPDLGLSSGMDWNSQLATQIKILQSDALAWDVVKRLRLDQKPPFAGDKLYTEGSGTWYSHHGLRSLPNEPLSNIGNARRQQLLARFQLGLDVTEVPRTGIVQLRFRSSDPELAAAVVNELAEAYTEHNFQVAYESTIKASDWLAKQLVELKTGIQSSEQQIADYQKTHKIIGTDENNNLTLATLDDVSKQYTDAQADRIMKEAKYRLAKSGNPELIGMLVPDSVLPVLRTQEADIQNQLSQATAIYGPNYPRVVELKKQLAQVNASLAKETRDIEARFSSEYEASLNTENKIKGNFDQHQQEALSKSQNFSEYSRLRREVDTSRDIYDDLLRKLREAGVMASLKAANIDVVDAAPVPIKPVEPAMKLAMALGLIGGLFMGFAGVVVAEAVDQSLKTPDDVELITSLPVIGVIPNTAVGRSSNGRPGRTAVKQEAMGIDVLTRPNSQFSESFRTLRTSIMLSFPSRPPKSLVVTSALPGEGKSTISMNVAGTLVQRGARVLLVDADMRRGRLASRAGAQEGDGLTECLSGLRRWTDVVQDASGIAGLRILSAGVRPPNPAELLSSDKLKEMLEEWQKNFDHVIFDAPPALVVTDAVVLALLCDAVLLVARSGVTHRSALRRSYEMLLHDGIRVAGVILNMYNPAGDYGYYGSNYYSYYHEGEGVKADRD
ncbi:Protein-tyrosine kinase [Candidatus Koribacter versatilis Ellin345]|uniref:non-specific protein-tyrosine kinase n=1 Tax=Koribacter versatilis (strain Ellin345) TaxID=204669 RepID=Q1ILD9_KORVE|nr:polysaccharide biosynthesis tyrosine autokinase [Candidatus Koribacter versatilis]ABF42311.1 Protein-tyrosine kinase [Candidatus Koribacter versatilis Ellin345]